MKPSYASTLRQQKAMIEDDRQIKRNKRKRTRNELLFTRFLDEQVMQCQIRDPVSVNETRSPSASGKE